MTEVRSDGQLEDKSLGELVAIATGSVSHLVKSEIELAKLELKSDAKKAALGGTLFAVAGVAGGVVVIMFSFFAAYLLMMWGIWDWAAFGIVTLFYVVLAAALIAIGLWRMKKMSGASRTRKTMKDDLAMLRRGSSDDQPALTE
jgi:uncharacterized membrane protein YqjE